MKNRKIWYVDKSYIFQMKTNKRFIDISNTPLISDAVYQKLPRLLKECCCKFPNRRERDVFLTLLLAVASGCFPGIKGNYSRRWYYPNLFVLIVAPPANGKGVIRFVKLLGMPLHKRLINQSKNRPPAQKEEGDNKQKTKDFQLIQNPGLTCCCCT